MKSPVPPGKGALILAAAAWLLSGIYTVERDEEGVVRLFGRPWKPRVPSGIHYAPPWPVGSRTVVRTTTAYQMSVGFKIADSVRGLPPARTEVEFLTADTNIIDLEMILQYTIENPFRFALMVEDPHFLVRRAAEAAATGILARTGVDLALTSGRSSFLEEARRETQAMLRETDAGVTVVSATLKRIEPPGEVVESFQDVQNAKSDRERAINEANGYRNEILPRARGEAEAALSSAEADRRARIERARGDADRFLRVLAEYRKAPRETRERLYLEVAERVLPKAKVYVIDSDGGRNPVGVKLID